MNQLRTAIVFAGAIWFLAGAPAAAHGARQVMMQTAPANLKLFEEWGLAEAVIDGDRIYLSGVVAGLRDGETDPSAAFDRAFNAIADILTRSGSSWDEVLDMTTYHTDLPAQIEPFKAVKQRYVRAPFPAWTAIDIDRLVPERGLVEIKVVARLAPKEQVVPAGAARPSGRRRANR